MTATMQNLYDNIKTLITKYFEEKTIEDETLPELVESYFNYNQGKLDIDMPHMELKVTGSSFETYSSTPFTYTGAIFVDWGDNTGLIEYTGGKLSHSYSVSDTYTIKIYGDITSLGSHCFFNCTGLTSITLPDSVTILRNGCFSGCTSLISITIPNSVTTLENACFYGCTNLTSILIPDSVTSLWTGCFVNCTGLTEIVLLWDSSSEIIEYNFSLIRDCTNFNHFLIPKGTTSLYTTKSYPSNLLVESD